MTGICSNVYFRKQNQTNPDIKSDMKPRDARWIDPTPKTHPELVKIKSRPQTAPSRSSSRSSYSRHDDQYVTYFMYFCNFPWAIDYKRQKLTIFKDQWNESCSHCAIQPVLSIGDDIVVMILLNWSYFTFVTNWRFWYFMTGSTSGRIFLCYFWIK